MEHFLHSYTQCERAFFFVKCYSRREREEEKKQVDKFAFSFDLNNNLTKFTLNPKFDTIFTFKKICRKKNCFQISDFHSHSLNKSHIPSLHKFDGIFFSLFNHPGLVPNLNYITFFFLCCQFKIEKECIFTGSASAWIK